MQPHIEEGVLQDHSEPLAGFAMDSAPAPAPAPAPPTLDADELDFEFDEEDAQ
jgi:hypothetical protein